MPFFGEVFTSEIIKKPVLDPKGEELGRVKDLAVVKGDPLPRVDALIVERKKKFFFLPWTDLTIFNKKIIASRIYADGLRPYELSEEDLLIVRDIFDKQIVDANGAKVVRVNDIKLEGYDDDAVLIGVDVGMRGILRRLGIERGSDEFLGLFNTSLPQTLISWNYIQPLRPKLGAIGLTVPRQMLAELHPNQFAILLLDHRSGRLLSMSTVFSLFPKGRQSRAKVPGPACLRIKSPLLEERLRLIVL